MKVQHRLIPLEDSAAWSSALEGLPHSFWHRQDVCAAFSTRADRTCLYVVERGSERAICPLSERTIGTWADVYTPFGFSGFAGTLPPEEFDSQWREFALHQGWVCGYIALHPVLGDPTWKDAESTNSVYILDLRLDDAVLWANLSRSRRRQLRDWGTVRSSLLLDRHAISHFFIENYHAFASRVGAPRAQLFSTETLELLCQLDSVLMVGAGRADSVEAAYLFGHTAHVGECLFNISTTEWGRDHATAMLWWGVDEMKKRAVPWLNMGGGLRENDLVARAKQQFGTIRVPFRRLKQVYRYDVYDRLCHEAGVQTDSDSGYFPAYRVPQQSEAHRTPSASSQAE